MKRGWVVVVVLILAVVAAFIARRSETAQAAENPAPATTTPSLQPTVATNPGSTVPAAVDASTALAAPTADLTIHVTTHGKPVAGARVTSWRDAGLAAGTGVRLWESGPVSTSQADGAALLEVMAGRWLIAVEAEHHQRRNAIVTHSIEQPGSAEFDLGEGLLARGLVVAKKTQQPVPDATVAVRSRSGEQLPGEAAHSTITDLNGRFTLEDLTPEEDVLVVTAPSYATRRLLRGDPKADLRIELLDGAYLTGHVFTPDGGVAAGARVVAAFGSEVTDESTSSGAFSLEVTPGAWNVGASRDGWVASSKGPLSVSAGETIANLDLVLRPGGSLEGTVKRAKTGEVVVGAEVIVSPHRVAGELAKALTDATGHYVAAPMPTGAVDVQVRAKGFPESVVQGLLTRAGAVTHLDVSMLEPGAIAGHVQTRDRPLPGIKVTIPETASATTDAHGDFLIPGLPAGETRVELGRADYPQLNRAVTVRAGETTHETFTLDDGLRHVTGVVLDLDGGVAHEGAGVGATLGGREAEVQVTTGPEGRFTLGLSDGHWRVYAFEEGKWAAQAVDVSEKTAPLVLRLERTEKGPGCLVLDAQNRPVAAAHVVFSSGDSYAVTFSGPDGVAPVIGPAAAAATVSASSQSRLGSAPFTATECSVHLEAAATLAVHFRTPPAAMVTISVPDGLPINVGGGATLQVTGGDAEFPIPPGTTTIEMRSGTLSASPTVTAAPGQRIELEVTLQRSDAG